MVFTQASRVSMYKANTQLLPSCMSNKDRLGVPLNSSKRAITIFQIFRQTNYAHLETEN